MEPPLPTRFFTGRGDVLQQLDRALQHNSTVALSGMPGVGKTQIALQCARSHKGVYQPIYWAVAASRDTLAAGYAAIAWRLGLPEKSQKDQTLVNNAVRRWLREHEGWLLILDNADDLEAIQALLPPSDHRGHLLLTTRESAFLPEAEPVPIEEMPEDDGATFLLRRAPTRAGRPPGTGHCGGPGRGAGHHRRAWRLAAGPGTRRCVHCRDPDRAGGLREPLPRRAAQTFA